MEIDLTVPPFPRTYFLDDRLRLHLYSTRLQRGPFNRLRIRNSPRRTIDTAKENAQSSPRRLEPSTAAVPVRHLLLKKVKFV